jgi:hypothetical protein
MAAVTRWVQYAISGEGVISTGGATVSGLGTRKYIQANSSVGDSFDFATSNNRLYIEFDGDSSMFITLTSGTELDPRLVARDITEKIHNTGKIGGYTNAQCVWENNKIKIYSGTLGSSSDVAVTSGTNTAHLELGFGSSATAGGSATANQYVGGLTTSGTYDGFFDEIYHVKINSLLQIGTPGLGGSNNYTGTITAGGVFDYATDITYTISIDVTNGTTMGAGTGNVPTMEWTSTGSADDSSAAVELLYPDYWYKLGTQGVIVKFSDAVFNTCDPAWTIVCDAAEFAEGANPQSAAGTAKYMWSSSRGDDATSVLTTSDTAFTRLGTRGVYIKFTGSGNFLAGDDFFVICKPPQPSSYDITNLNYGNVTVSTESAIKCVMFEIMSGGVEMSTVKFGLQSDGTFSHHDTGNSDTEFHFGTIGPGNNSGANPVDGKEWRVSVTSSDIGSDTPPAYLYATAEDLAVVADADNSETLGASHYMGMVADPIYLGIKLGANEVGANSSINYRLYFDYS